MHGMGEQRVAGDVVAVLCNPFGYEAICAHRTYRILAENLATAGIPSIHFDYAGTNDSAPHESAPNVQNWLASTHQTIDAAKQLTGARRVVLLGVRADALVTTVTNTQHNDIMNITQIAPLLSKRTYLQELRTLQMALRLAPAPVGAVNPPEGGQEAVGFYLSADAKAALSKVDLLKAPKPPAPRALVLDRDDFPASEKYLERLRTLDITTTHERLPGYIEMMFDPHKVVVPRAIVDAATRWTVKVATEVDNALAPAELAPSRETNVAPNIIEHTINVANLFEIVSTPHETSTKNNKTVVFLNASSIHQIGPNGLFAHFAHEYASLDYITLRLDLSNINNTPPRTGKPANVTYSTHAHDDLNDTLT